MVNFGLLFATRGGLARLLDLPRIEAAIREAERGTSGELRVSVAPFFLGSVRRTAERAFVRLGMARTRERNGVLLFLAPARREVVILGDEGIHATVGQGFWEALAAELSGRFGKGDFTGGLEWAIARVGEQLARSFPHRPDDEDELPDTVDFGDKAPHPPLAHL